ncbi:DUF397 domain-containing protein [Streptomyces sp. NBC_01465]|uniref:DUF397 domain-containing protein n=1 Tax=Streptomyces sp. NBC_01465 TaxID=2903878 RepID=UPI002E31A2B2|nr:DUF397 domain-containing protein [Streptomyces sp. NBC_01465]
MTTVMRWQKSSFSGGAEGNECVEVAASADAVHLRESDDPTRTLTLTPRSLAALLDRIRTVGA